MPDLYYVSQGAPKGNASGSSPANARGSIRGIPWGGDTEILLERGRPLEYLPPSGGTNRTGLSIPARDRVRIATYGDAEAAPGVRCDTNYNSNFAAQANGTYRRAARTTAGVIFFQGQPLPYFNSAVAGWESNLAQSVYGGYAHVPGGSQIAVKLPQGETQNPNSYSGTDGVSVSESQIAIEANNDGILNAFELEDIAIYGASRQGINIRNVHNFLARRAIIRDCGGDYTPQWLVGGCIQTTGGCEDILVELCTLGGCWDSILSPQTPQGKNGVGIRRLTYRNNVLRGGSALSGIEIAAWADNTFFEDFLIEGNSIIWEPGWAYVGDGPNGPVGIIINAKGGNAGNWANTLFQRIRIVRNLIQDFPGGGFEVFHARTGLGNDCIEFDQNRVIRCGNGLARGRSGNGQVKAIGGMSVETNRPINQVVKARANVFADCGQYNVHWDAPNATAGGELRNNTLARAPMRIEPGSNRPTVENNNLYQTYLSATAGLNASNNGIYNPVGAEVQGGAAASAASVTAAPQLVSPGAGPLDFRLLASSPLRNQGLAPSTDDVDGNAYTANDIGAHAFAVVSGEVFFDDLVDQLRDTVIASNSVTIPLDDAVSFASSGDHSAFEMRRNGGGWVGLAGFSNAQGETLELRLRTADADSAMGYIDVTIGSDVSRWNVETAAPVQVNIDNFNAPDGTLLPDHDPEWTIVAGDAANTLANGSIQANQYVVAQSRRQNWYYAASDSLYARCRVSRQGGSGDARGCGPAVCMGPGQPGYAVALGTPNGAGVHTAIVWYKNNVYQSAVVSGLSIDPASLPLLELEVDISDPANVELKVWLNDPESGSNAPLGTVTDSSSPFTSGSPGFRVSGNGAVADQVVEDFADSRTVDVAPQLTGAGPTLVYAGEVDLDVLTDKFDGTLAYVITASATVPDGDQVLAGNDHADVAAQAAGSATPAAAGLVSFADIPVAQGTWYAHFVHERFGLQSDVVSSQAFVIDTTAPTLLSAAIGPADDDILTLTFDKEMDFGADGGDHFTLDLSGGPVTASYLNDIGLTVLTYELSRSVDLTIERGTLDHAQPGAGVLDQSGNALAAISDFPIVIYDGTPETSPFPFVNELEAALDAVLISNEVPITDEPGVVTVTFTGHSSLRWRKNAGSWQTGDTTGVQGDVFEMELRASDLYRETRTGTMTAGSRTGDFVVRTIKDPTITPDDDFLAIVRTVLRNLLRSLLRRING